MIELHFWTTPNERSRPSEESGLSYQTGRLR